MADLSPARSAALALIAQYVPSDYGDPKFAEIINGSWAPGYGTTCGYLTSWLLWRLGCADAQIVNRNEPAQGLAYHTAQNISRLVAGAKALGAYRTSGTPRPGDLYFVYVDPPVVTASGAKDWRNHVGVVLRVSDDGATWHTADAGQGSATAQSARYNDRSYQAGGAPKLLVGGTWRFVHFIDLDAIAFGAPPKPLPGGAPGDRGVSEQTNTNGAGAGLGLLLALVGLGLAGWYAWK